MSRDNLHVKFNGVELVWFKDEKGSGPLAPMNHVDNKLELRPECCLEESYAHVYPNGHINRYGTIIGSVADLEFIPMAKE